MDFINRLYLRGSLQGVGFGGRFSLLLFLLGQPAFSSALVVLGLALAHLCVLGLEYSSALVVARRVHWIVDIVSFCYLGRLGLLHAYLVLLPGFLRLLEVWYYFLVVFKLDRELWSSHSWPFEFRLFSIVEPVVGILSSNWADIFDDGYFCDIGHDGVILNLLVDFPFAKHASDGGHIGCPFVLPGPFGVFLGLFEAIEDLIFGRELVDQ